jgi:2-oxoisovalerate dehydrogenase E1 component alpha subunit
LRALAELNITLTAKPDTELDADDLIETPTGTIDIDDIVDTGLAPAPRDMFEDAFAEMPPHLVRRRQEAGY